MLAEFLMNDGSPVTVNMDQVDYFRPCRDGTLVVFAERLSTGIARQQ